MGKYISYLFIIVMMILLVMFLSGKDRKVSDFKIDKNSLKVEGLQVMENTVDGGFYVVKAQKADVSENFSLINMHDCSILYKSGKYTLDMISDSCRMVKNENITLRDNISGNFNNYLFKTGEKGVFNYDLKTLRGTIINGLTVNSETIELKSEQGEIDRGNMTIKFIGDVEVIYNG